MTATNMCSNFGGFRCSSPSPVPGIVCAVCGVNYTNKQKSHDSLAMYHVHIYIPKRHISQSYKVSGIHHSIADILFYQCYKWEGTHPTKLPSLKKKHTQKMYDLSCTRRFHSHTSLLGWYSYKCTCKGH